MINQKRFIVSHAPFWHDGSGITERSYNIFLAALPAAVFGLVKYGMPAVGVLSLSVSLAILWELAFNKVAKEPVTIGDGNAALVGLLFGMVLPATAPWWLVLVGTFIAVVVGKQIYGGIGGNPFNPVAVAMAILMLSWGVYIDIDASLVHYEFSHYALYPMGALKHFGASAVDGVTAADLLMGRQAGAIGASFGLGLIIGGVYLILRGFIRWEICLSFLVGILLTALMFKANDPARFGGPAIHLFSGYTLIGAFFLATEDASSPVNTLPMIIYGLLGGMMTVLIRNIGAYIDGVFLSILIINTINPLLDKIRPKALGKVV